MSIGLIALLDDIAAIAKAAAASLDDVVTQAAKAGVKAAGVVIDDTAVTPRYVLGFAAERELPIVGKIAAGSLRNKLLLLLPATLAFSYFVPWMITPLLMFGGAYLCYEGAEKVLEAIMPHRAHAHEAQLGTVALKPQTLEDEKVASAIKTDFILSAEIMAITLASIPNGGIFMQALVLALVGIGITVVVYGSAIGTKRTLGTGSNFRNVWRCAPAMAKRGGRALGDKARPAISALVFTKREPIGRGYVRSEGTQTQAGKTPAPLEPNHKSSPGAFPMVIEQQWKK